MVQNLFDVGTVGEMPVLNDDSDSVPESDAFTSDVDRVAEVFALMPRLGTVIILQRQRRGSDSITNGTVMWEDELQGLADMRGSSLICDSGDFGAELPDLLRFAPQPGLRRSGDYFRDFRPEYQTRGTLHQHHQQGLTFTPYSASAYWRVRRTELSNCLNGLVMANAVHLDEEDTAVNGDCGRGPPA